MLNKLSFNLAKELNESETKTFKIKKRVFMEGTKIKVEKLESELQECDKPLKEENNQDFKVGDVVKVPYKYGSYTPGEFTEAPIIEIEDGKYVTVEVPSKQVVMMDQLKKWNTLDESAKSLKEGFKLGEKAEILDKTERRGQPVALVKLQKMGDEYVVAFGYTVENDEISWDYGYYYYDEASGKEAFEKVKAGGNLSESAKSLKEEYSEKLGGDPEDFVSDVETIKAALEAIDTNSFGAKLSVQMVNDWIETCNYQIERGKRLASGNEFYSESEKSLEEAGGPNKPIEKKPVNDDDFYNYVKGLLDNGAIDDPSYYNSLSDKDKEDLIRNTWMKDKDIINDYNKLSESEKTKKKLVVEAAQTEVKDLQVVKEQGNIYMLEDKSEGTRYIVGENYNLSEGEIENAEIYESKEEADKDYLDRCEVIKDGEEFNPDQPLEDTSESENTDLKEDTNTDSGNNLVKAIQDAFDGSDFTVGNISFEDNNIIKFDIYAIGNDGEELTRDVKLDIPNEETYDNMRNIVEEWIQNHNSPDLFYED